VAVDNCRFGFERVFDYLAHVVPTPPVEATSYDGRVKEMNDSGVAVIGTPDSWGRLEPRTTGSSAPTTSSSMPRFDKSIQTYAAERGRPAPPSLTASA